MKTKSSKKTAQRTTEFQLPSRFTMRNLGKGTEVKLVDSESGSEVRIPATAKSAVLLTLSTFFGDKSKADTTAADTTAADTTATDTTAPAQSEPAAAAPVAEASPSTSPAPAAEAPVAKKRGRQPKVAAAPETAEAPAPKKRGRKPKLDTAAQEAVAAEITSPEPTASEAPAADTQVTSAEAAQPAPTAGARQGSKGTSRKTAKAATARKASSARGRAAGASKSAKKAASKGEAAQPARAAARSAKNDAVKAAPAKPAKNVSKASSKKGAAAAAAAAPVADAPEWTSSLPKEEKSGNITLKMTSVAVDPSHQDRILGSTKEHPQGKSAVAYDILIDNSHKGHVLAQSPTRFVIVAPDLQSEKTIHRGLKPAILRLEVAMDYMKKQA